MPNWLNPMTPFNYVTDQLFPDPSKKAMGPIDQIPGQMKPYYQPYINGGNWAMPQLQEQFGQMMKDPNEIISRLGQGYQQSPGYKWQLGQGEEAINNASAAGGMAGSPQHQQQAGQLASNLANQDFQNYMNQNLGLLGMGTQGAMGLGQMGYGASSDLASSLAQALMSKSNLQYAGQANKNQQTGGLLGNILGMFGKAFKLGE